MFETNKKTWSAEELGLLESIEGNRKLVRLGRTYAAITAKKSELGVNVGSGNISNYYRVHTELSKTAPELKTMLDVILHLLKKFSSEFNAYMRKAYHQYYVDLIQQEIDISFPSYTDFNAKEELQFYAFGGKKIINPHHENLATLSWLEQSKREPVKEEEPSIATVQEPVIPAPEPIKEEKKEVVIPPNLSPLPAQPVIIIVGNLKITIEQQ